MDFKGLSDPVVLTSEPSKKSGFFSKLRPPQTNFFRNRASSLLHNKGFLSGALTVFLLFAVGAGVYISQQPTQLIPHAQEIENSTTPTNATSENEDLNHDGEVNLQDLSILISKGGTAIEYSKLRKILIERGIIKDSLD